MLGIDFVREGALPMSQPSVRNPVTPAVRRALFLFVSLAAAVACSPSPDPQPPAPQVTAAQAQAARELAMYRELVAAESWELAAPIGRDMVNRDPDSAAAREVAATLADVEAKAAASSKARRMTKLWAYQRGGESGGKQVTASIYSEDPVDARIRLVLRRHSEWGQSVYLFGPGFRCGSPCRIAMRFDDGPTERLEASIPPTGEPALFIEDDRKFIARLEDSESISMDVVQKDGTRRTIEFLVGGYDATKFPQLPQA